MPFVYDTVNTFYPPPALSGNYERCLHPSVKSMIRSDTFAPNLMPKIKTKLGGKNSLLLLGAVVHNFFNEPELCL